MDINKQIKLKFHGVDFPVVNFQSDKVNPTTEGMDIKMNFNPKVHYPKEHPDFFRIVQEINLESEKNFSLFIVAVGTFELGKDTDDATKKSFVNLNAPAIMFPYVRSFISTLTGNLGNVIGTLTIPPQLFQGDLEEIIDIPQN
ncbi:protein-export chaperone SecB [Winogradskyella aurantiaca]|uniref:protein-export chaperone SecB n=1 Tax=Winogradskyella aurantiaca TaxID=2219558 RepID=UPI000E1C5F3C|nr:protein-export chaperone SecB [Winogradskyella aurantiaca]